MGLRLEDVRRVVEKVQKDRGDDPGPGFMSSAVDQIRAFRAIISPTAQERSFDFSAPDASPSLRALTGTVLEQRYRLGRILGSGGMGAVFEARHLRLDRPVAIKVLRPRLATESEYIERFLREAKASSKIRHRNVLEILDHGETAGGLVYSVMPLLVGRDLEQVLRAQPQEQLPWTMVHGLLVQIASGLKAAHGQGVIHRDIKPANCFLTDEDGEPVVKLLDFGIAKLEQSPDGHTLTSTAQIMGTPGYIAPELMQTRQSASPRSDIYGLGVMAYRMLTGRLPFSGKSMFEMMRRSCFDPVPSLRTQVPELPPEVEALVLQMLAKTPEQRPADMRTVRDQLMKLGPATLRTQVGVLLGSSVLPSKTDGALPSGADGTDRQTLARVAGDFATTMRAPGEVANGGRPPDAADDLPRSMRDLESTQLWRSGDTLPADEASTLHSKGAPRLLEHVRRRARPWLVLGAGVTAVVGALGMFAMLERDDDAGRPSEAAVLVVNAEVEPAEVEPAEVEPAEVEPVEVEPVEVEPAEGAMASTNAVEPMPEERQIEPPPSSKKPKPKHKAVDRSPSDSVVLDRLKRKIAQSCATALRHGPVTLKFLVTTSGRVMGLTGTGTAGSCARDQVQGAKFRARSESTPFKITVE